MVALARFDGQARTDHPREAGGRGACRQHDGARPIDRRGGADGRDGAVGAPVEARDARSQLEARACALGRRVQPGDEEAGIAMAVLAPEHGARDVVAQEGLALPCAGAVEHLRLEALGLEQADVLQQLLEGLLAAAYVHQACVVVAQLEAAAAEILHEVAAAATEVAQGAYAAQHPPPAAAAHELEPEARQRGGEARLHVDGPAGPHEPGDPPQQ